VVIPPAAAAAVIRSGRCVACEAVCETRDAVIASTIAHTRIHPLQLMAFTSLNPLQLPFTVMPKSSLGICYQNQSH
jgi:hypothetical protein